MSESQKWRPPVAPKPTLHPGNAREHEQSAALRGATLAFKPPAPKPTGATGPKPTGRGALDAATAADKLGRQEQQQQQSTDIRNARSPVRGRSQLSLDLQRAVDHTSSTSSRNPLHRTASEIAARAASASSSPARSHPASSRPSSPQRQRSLSRESSLSHRSQLPSDTDTRDALRGATLSMSASPSNGTASPFSNKAGKLDFQKIPSLTQQAARPAVVQRQPPPKVQSKAPAVGAPPSNEAMEISKAPPPPPKRQTKKRSTHDTQDYVESPKSVTTPTVTLSEPDDTAGQVAGASGPHKKPSKPIPVPRRQPARTSPPANASPSASDWSPRSHRGSMTAHNLADAMVGASLASSRQGSRAASPAKHKPSPMPRRRSKSVDLFRPHLTGEKAPPLKPLAKRPMKHTLRKQSPEHEEEDETKRGRKHLIRKHPHMHSEGDRKRWRDKISERERKRYEGVWASNRGLLHEHESSVLLNRRSPDTNPEDLVLNVVVRDIWNRSRLPHDVLEEIWDLVSPEPDYRALTRERFVVGMWLVDQRLKGRKLPVKVSASVWQSARHMGIKVSSKPF